MQHYNKTSTLEKFFQICLKGWTATSHIYICQKETVTSMLSCRNVFVQTQSEVFKIGPDNARTGLWSLLKKQ
jgi:hypothetical protein